MTQQHHWTLGEFVLNGLNLLGTSLAILLMPLRSGHDIDEDVMTDTTPTSADSSAPSLKL